MYSREKSICNQVFPKFCSIFFMIFMLYIIELQTLKIQNHHESLLKIPRPVGDFKPCPGIAEGGVKIPSQYQWSVRAG